MKQYLFILTILLFFTTTMTTKLYAQTYTTVSKRCGKCSKAVSTSSKIGDICPHCGVRWGYENTTTTSTKVNKPSYNNYIDIYSPPSTKQANTNTKSSQNITPPKSNPFASYTKQMTEEWLMERFQKYSQKRVYCSSDPILSIGGCSTYDGFEFKFDSDYLIVKYNYNNVYDEIVYIPIYDFSYAYGKSYGSDFSISTTSNTMYEINKRDNTKRVTSFVSIGFKNDSETDLIENIEFAFKRLKKFYKKPATSILPDFISQSELNKPSLSETKIWILEKLNAYKLNVFHPGETIQTPFGSRNLSSSDHNFSFEFFNEEWLTIKYYVGEGQYEQLQTVQIPICDVTISKKRYEYNSSTANLEFYSSYKKIMKAGGNTNDFSIQIDFSREENLESRILKAFANLKSYCKTVKQKETF